MVNLKGSLKYLKLCFFPIHFYLDSMVACTTVYDHKGWRSTRSKLALGCPSRLLPSKQEQVVESSCKGAHCIPWCSLD